MDFGATISRALNIVLKHRALWVLGFLAALAGGGGGSANLNLPSGRSFGSPTSASGGQVPPEIQRFFDLFQQNQGAIIAGVLGLFCVLFAISIVLWLVSIVAQGGLIGGVEQIERDGATTFGQAWRVGTSKFAPLLGLNILIGIPTFVIIVLAIVLVGGALIPLIPLITAGASGQNSDTVTTGLASAGIGVACIGSALLCVGAIYGLLAQAISTFGGRAIVLDNMGVVDSIRKGWEVFRANLGNIILLAIVMLVISSVIGLIVGLVSAAVFVPVLLTGVIGAVSDTGGFNIGAGTIVLAAIAFVAVAIIAAVIGALFKAFNSTAWTLAYRQFTGNRLLSTGSNTPPPTAPLPTA